MYEDERLKKIEQLLIKHDGQLQNLSGKDEAQKRYMRDLMTNLDDSNIPSLRFKVTKKGMTAAIEAYATEAEAAIDLKLTGYYTAAALNLLINDVESNISLVAQYTGQDGVVTVATSAAWTALTPKVTTTVYYVTETGKYMKYNGTAWVPCSNISEASFLMSAINGESTIKINADQIVNTGTVSFLDSIGLEAGTSKIKGGWLEADTVATNALKKRTESNLDWLDFYAGIDMTVLDVEDTAYYPDTRQIKGIKSIRLYKDTDLTAGHGDAGNALAETGSLQVNTTGINTLMDSWGSGVSLFMVDTDYPTALELSSGSGVAISSGKAAWQSGPIVLTAYNDSIKNSGYMLRVTKVGIQFYKYTSGAPTLLEQWV